MQVSWKIISNNPVIGIGVDNFQSVSKLNNDVHNGFLLIWAEGGILSIIGTLLITFAFPIYIITSSAQDFGKVSRKINSITLSFTLLFIINIASNTQFYDRYWFVPFFLLLKLITLSKKLRYASASSNADYLNSKNKTFLR
jgi:O-antigen ligase